MRVLLEHGAGPSMCARVYHMKKSIGVVKLLVEFGYDIRVNGHCILQDYAHDRDVLDWLLDHGVDINQTDHERSDNGTLPGPGNCVDFSFKVLSKVAAQGDIALFDHLVARGADPHRSMTLHCATKCKDPDNMAAMIDHLIDVHGRDIEADNDKLRKIFHSAGDSGTPLIVNYRNLAAVHKLLTRGADPTKALNDTTSGHINPLWTPALAPSLDAGMSLDRVLEHAVDFLHFEVANTCVAKGADAARVLGIQMARLAKMEAG